ncbi:phage tail-like protein [Sphingomonas naasensis]|uniref:Phage tail protein n=1 Tax=Sphingomonas naasensis TaxID=1344951 RepID=A0A4S1WLI4_9SPHN|nr:phage tail protein [Sphingomonas naasensis]NIJ20905.1 phage tail-like protein [Sphingomonas naasensis]TGX43295.1 phage tail protein [Sphingomonas naasensis]
MADGTAQDEIWPLPKFYFNIDLGDGKMQGFSEISGLESETKAIEYRHGDSAVFAPIKMPGLRSVGNVTLKKGVFTKDSIFWDWFNETQLNIIKRRTVIINLLNEKASPMMTWTLTNAFPVKMQATDMKSDASEVAIETLELAYETLAVKAA